MPMNAVSVRLTLLFCAPCLLAGCAHKDAPMPKSAAAATRGQISAEEAQKQIQGVQANTQIPDSVKPGIIASIQAKTGPAQSSPQ